MRRLVTLTVTLVLAAAVPTVAQDEKTQDLCLRVTAGPGAMLNGPLAVATGIKNGLIEIAEVVPCDETADEPEPTAESEPDGSAGTEENAVVEPVPAIPLPTPKPIKNADFRGVVKQAGYHTFTAKPFFEDSLRVWVNGEPQQDTGIGPTGFEVENANKGKYSVYGFEAGDIVQAKYDRKKQVTRKKTFSRNGSDDFFLKLPWYPDKVRFTVRSDSSYGCSAYVYVWGGSYWESMNALSMSFDGWKKKTRQIGYFDNEFRKGKQRTWVNTNCPWTLTFLTTKWVKA